MSLSVIHIYMVPTGLENQEKSWNLKNSFKGWKVQEFRQICPNVLVKWSQVLKTSVIVKLIPELVNLWHYKCWKDHEYCKNMPKWTWKMAFWVLERSWNIP